MIVYLNVPYKDKDIAKALGCWWDPDMKMWWIHVADGFSPNLSFNENRNKLPKGQMRSWLSKLNMEYAIQNHNEERERQFLQQRRDSTISWKQQNESKKNPHLKSKQSFT